MYADIDAEKNESSQPCGIVPMRFSRKYWVLFLLAAILSGHLYSVITKTEYWPLSRYPMYSALHRDQWTDEFLVGTLRDDPSQEIDISYLSFDKPISIKASLNHLMQSAEHDRAQAERLRQALLAIGMLYREQGGGHRPTACREIGTLRLVKVIWEVVPGQGHTRATEVSRELMMEVVLPDGGLAVNAVKGR